jgi:ADP-ribosylglycohydrolase
MTSPSQLAGLLLGSLTADSFSLGQHWIYDQAQIPETPEVSAPASSYHPGKAAGDYTHLGDQTLILARSIAATGDEFDPMHFMAAWRTFWEAPGQQSYKDKATRTVFENLARGESLLLSGALSAELAGPARAAPVLASGLRKGVSEKELIALAQSQTQLTHRCAEAVDTAAFYARLLLNIAAGLDMDTALDAALCDSSQFVRDLGGKATSARVEAMETLEAIAWLGQSCDLDKALPACVLLLQRHGGSYEEAITMNVRAGGDSAARGLFIGGVLGFMHGEKAIPAAWRNALRQPA